MFIYLLIIAQFAFKTRYNSEYEKCEFSDICSDLIGGLFLISPETYMRGNTV